VNFTLGRMRHFEHAVYRSAAQARCAVGAASQRSEPPCGSTGCLRVLLASGGVGWHGVLLAPGGVALTHSARSCALGSSRCGTGRTFRGLRALRAAVLRRAVSQFSLSVATRRRRSAALTEGLPAYAGFRKCVLKGQSVRLTKQRPNPSVERTHNGGARFLAPSRSATPLCAAHVKR